MKNNPLYYWRKLGHRPRLALVVIAAIWGIWLIGYLVPVLLAVPSIVTILIPSLWYLIDYLNMTIEGKIDRFDELETKYYDLKDSYRILAKDFKDIKNEM